MESIVMIVYFGLLVIASLAAFLRRRQLGRADKWLLFLLVVTLVDEVAARYLASRYHNNMIAYHIYNPVELFLVCCYYNESVSWLRTGNKAVWLGVAGICFALINTVFLQPSYTLNSNFLFFESLCIMSLAIVAYAHLLVCEHVGWSRSAQFWITAAFLIYWSFSAVQWGMYVWLMDAPAAHNMLQYLLWVFNLGFYCILSLIFIAYHKMIPSHGIE